MSVLVRCGLLAAITLLAPLSGAEESWQLATLPAHRTTVTGTAEPVQNPGAVTDGQFATSQVLRPLCGATVSISLGEPTCIRRLAIVAAGWSDWAQARKVSWRVDDQEWHGVNLAGTRVRPDQQAVAAGETDSIALPGTVVSRIDVRVDAIDGSPNPWGGIEIAQLVPRPATIDFSALSQIPADAAGIRVTLAGAAGHPLLFRAHGYRFRQELEWRIERPGQPQVEIPFADLLCVQDTQLTASPAHLRSLDITDATGTEPVTIAAWEFLHDPTQHEMPAWEGLPTVVFPPDAEGWRPGIPQDGFGRFGWLPDDGLLVGSLSARGFSLLAQHLDAKPVDPSVAHFTYACGDGSALDWSRKTVHWCGALQRSVYRVPADGARSEPQSKAFGEFDRSLKTEDRFASVLAPGFLLRSQHRSITFGGPGSDPAVLMPTTAGLRWIASGAPIQATDLSAGWLLLVWPGAERFPLLLCPQQRPTAITTAEGQMRFAFSDEIGYFGVGFPGGARPWAGTIAALDGETTALADQARQLAGILRAYPWDSRMTFRSRSDTIEVREQLTHLQWRNAWGEDGHVVAPVPPLVAFAGDQGYPSQVEGTIHDSGIPTKYGPYRYADGASITYRLALPPLSPTYYCRPLTAGPDKLASLSHTLAGLADTRGPGVLARDCLGAWWLTAPISLAFPLISDADRAPFFAIWRKRLDLAVRADTWYLRQEPYSGATYPLSFGWRENSTDTIGDPNSGIGAVLYGHDAYARTSGDWATIRAHWPVLRGALRFFLMSHDWAHMQSGAREHSGSSAIDMDGIAYEGVVAFTRMADALGEADDAALGRLLVARYALSTCMRWQAAAWLAPGADPFALSAIGTGFNEQLGFDCLSLLRGGPDHINSEVALSLSWVGQFPELYDLHRWGLGDAFWQRFEDRLVEQRLDHWRLDHKGRRNNHPANVAAHLYMRGQLGETTEHLLAELVAQPTLGAWPNPAAPDVVRENAALYAMVLGRDCPVQVLDWGCAVPGHFDALGDGAVALDFVSPTPVSVILRATRVPTTVTCNDQPITVEQGPSSTLRIPLGVGKSTLRLQFAPW